MLETIKHTILILSALFPIVNPLGGSPIFLSMTKDCSAFERRALSRRVARNCFFLLVCSCLIGSHILIFFGISLPVVQVGGGLVVISTGWAMLKRGDEEENERNEEIRRQAGSPDILRNAFYPLSMPLTVGPGSISVAITLGANVPHHKGWNFLGFLAVVLGSLIISISIYVCYGFSERLARALGPSGMNVVIRLSSFLLVCIGVQICWNGIKTLLITIPGLR